VTATDTASGERLRSHLAPELTRVLGNVAACGLSDAMIGAWIGHT
jgi:hypothetical protein